MEHTVQLNDLTDHVVNNFRRRYKQAVANGDPDQELWDCFARAAELHRPQADTQVGLARCTECTHGTVDRVWPCHTLRLMASGLTASAHT
jgi:hypothetical protein